MKKESKGESQRQREEISSLPQASQDLFGILPDQHLLRNCHTVGCFVYRFLVKGFKASLRRPANHGRPSVQVTCKMLWSLLFWFKLCQVVTIEEREGERLREKERKSLRLMRERARGRERGREGERERVCVREREREGEGPPSARGFQSVASGARRLAVHTTQRKVECTAFNV